MKNILILSLSTGQGHNTAGMALREEFLSRGVNCVMKDAIAIRSLRSSKVVANTYIKMAVHTPRMFGGLYKTGMFISSDKRRSPIYWANQMYARALREYIDRHQVDAVVTPHLFPAETLTHLKKHGLCVPCYAVATDYTCIPFFEETKLDAFFIPSGELVPEYVSRGIPAELLIPTGIPVGKKCLVDMTKAQAREALGLEKDALYAVVMGGSMGFGNPETLVRELLHLLGPRGRVLIMGGSNEKMKAKLREDLKDMESAKVLDYTDKVPLYMTACDVLLTKPGGLTSTEAAVMRVPLVHTPPIPGCETKNIEFFTSLGLSVTADTEIGLAAAAAALAVDPAAQEKMRKRQATYINRYAAKDICDYILR